MPSPGVKNPAPSASQLCSVTGFLHFSLILSKGKSQTLWPGWETHEHRASGSSLSFGDGNSQEKRLCSNWHLWATAINEWVAHTGEGGSLSAHPMWSSPFVRENQKLPKNSVDWTSGRLWHRGVWNARIKTQGSHFKGIPILWSYCGEDQSLIRPVAKEITAMGQYIIAAKAKYSLYVDGTCEERLCVHFRWSHRTLIVVWYSILNAF